MRIDTKLVTAVLALIVSNAAFFSAMGQEQNDTALSDLGLGSQFTSNKVAVDGANIHYVRGGEGPALILLHGFPQNWSEFHAIMPRLAENFTVIAPDLRGIGQSTVSEHNYDAATMAADIYQLTTALKLSNVYVVGHDIGGMVAYAYACRYPRTTRGAMVLDTMIPGISGWESFNNNPDLWHVRFHQVPDLPETLIAGNQAEYFGFFFNFGTFTAEDTARYAQAYTQVEQLHAAFEMYRAFSANAEYNTSQCEPHAVPLLLAPAGWSPFANLFPVMADDLRAKGYENVATGAIAESVHYVVQDQPQAVIDLIENHAAQ